MEHQLFRVVALLGAAVVMVPIFRRLGLGSVLGYLAAGLAIGPFGLGWFADAASILHVAELGVVLFLFVIGLEMRPSHLWGMRGDIFGLGSLQVAVAGAALTAVGLLLGHPPKVAFIAAAGFVLTSTAIVMQLLEERGDVAVPRGRHIVAVLLFEDLLIVPLLAIVTFLSPDIGDGGGSRLASIGIAAGAVAGLVAAGIWLLNPLFRVLAAARAREVMTAAALLVVLGAAVLMQLGGLSMAMGAFLAGVLLSESTFRHQIEADIEPFRGILLGLFFMGVGMSLDLGVVATDAPAVAIGVGAMIGAKALAVYGVGRALGSSHGEALDRAATMGHGGEFAFVLYGSAAAAHVIAPASAARFTAVVVISMALNPLVGLLARRLGPRPEASMAVIEVADGLAGSALVIGFGRFGQVTCQSLLALGVDVAIIDTDIEMIRDAEKFGFKIYFGDGTRLDVLRASGATTARAILVCVDQKDAANKIVELVRAEFPQARLLVRAFDRGHSHELIRAGVDVQIRETFESALRFGEAALRELGVPADEAAEVAAEVRRRDAERIELEIAGGGFAAGRALMHTNTGPKPTPFTTPRREARALNPEASEALEETATAAAAGEPGPA
jgi:glutathione-regulated potassium-efflux system protein KefB